MNVRARLEYEIAYYDSAVQRFNHYTTRVHPLFVGTFFAVDRCKKNNLEKNNWKSLHSLDNLTLSSASVQNISKLVWIQFSFS